MIKIVLILTAALALTGCMDYAPPAPHAVVAFLEDGAPMTNELSLRTQQEWIRSHRIVGKTVDALNLAETAQAERAAMVKQVGDALVLTPNISAGTITIALRDSSFGDEARIINTLCEHLIEDQEIVSALSPAAREGNTDSHGIRHSDDAQQPKIQITVTKAAFSTYGSGQAH